MFLWVLYCRWNPWPSCLGKISLNMTLDCHCPLPPHQCFFCLQHQIYKGKLSSTAACAVINSGICLVRNVQLNGLVEHFVRDLDLWLGKKPDAESEGTKRTSSVSKDHTTDYKWAPSCWWMMASKNIDHVHTTAQQNVVPAGSSIWAKLNLVPAPLGFTDPCSKSQLIVNSCLRR